MDYHLSRLGSRNFEHMCRALFEKQLGPTVEHFGDGPDGGREATYRGLVAKLNGLDDKPWDGFVVLQAKFRQRPLGMPEDQDWLVQQIRTELRDWADPAKKRRARGSVPDYLVIASNVVLSAANNGGVDTIAHVLQELGPPAGIRGWLVWHYDKFCSMLDDAPNVRRAYRGLITPGDVLEKLLEDLEGAASDLGETLRLHAAQTLVQERFVRLAESGGSTRLTLEQVGVDLPILRPVEDGWSAGAHAVAELVGIGDNVLRHDHNPGEPSKIVLVGGPGQGKTTLSYLLAQVYRAGILRDNPTRHGRQVASVVGDTMRLMQDQGIPIPRNRRWPIHLNLAELAETTPSNTGGLLSSIAESISACTGAKLDRYSVQSWFHQHPWLLILDGYDEVASSSARGWLQRELSNLWVRADSVNSDLMTVITTRPQGYEDDFVPADAEHMVLAPLDTTEALNYAQRFADKHFGDDVTERDRVMLRVKAASVDSHTKRLMVTPLQITIITLLLEGRERAPHSRYRLFDAYFDTIYRREMNKPGGNGALLELHRRDIEHLHERVGLELQAASESADSSDAVLASERLMSLTRERLENQGHDPEAASQLSAAIVDKATTRLVLLVPRRHGVGFEIRSLQEYMAARSITQRSDAEVVQHIERAAQSAHWRNVWLLAVARALDVKEHLRDDLLATMGRLGAEPIAHRTGLVAELATELLGDSIAQDNPSFRQQLLDMVLAVLEYRHAPSKRHTSCGSWPTRSPSTGPPYSTPLTGHFTVAQTPRQRLGSPSTT